MIARASRKQTVTRILTLLSRSLFCCGMYDGYSLCCSRNNALAVLTVHGRNVGKYRRKTTPAFRAYRQSRCCVGGMFPPYVPTRECQPMTGTTVQLKKMYRDLTRTPPTGHSPKWPVDKKLFGLLRDQPFSLSEKFLVFPIMFTP